MLSKPDAQVVYNPDGTFQGVQSEGELAKADFVVGDPSYFPDKVTKTSNVVRAICILSHPIPNTDDSNSVQIIIPQRQVPSNVLPDLVPFYTRLLFVLHTEAYYILENPFILHCYQSFLILARYHVSAFQALPPLMYCGILKIQYFY